MKFGTVGYYISEPVLKPEYLSLNCKQLLSISSCLCDIHPDLNGCFWKNHKEYRIEYNTKLNLSEEQAVSLEKDVSKLFNSNLIDIDGRFVNYSDAVNFYKKYMMYCSTAKIIQVRMSIKDMNELTDEYDWNQSMKLPESNIIHGDYLGCEIVGFDFSGFHSYLCNSLEKDILHKYSVTINDYGILQNEYSEVNTFTESIQGKGEPVTWRTCLLYDCKI